MGSNLRYGGVSKNRRWGVSGTGICIITQNEELRLISERIIRQNEELILQNELFKEELNLQQKSIRLAESNISNQTKRRKKDNEPLLKEIYLKEKGKIIKNIGEPIKIIQVNCLNHEGVSAKTVELLPSDGELYLHVSAPDSIQYYKSYYDRIDMVNRSYSVLKTLDYELILEDKDGIRYKQKISFGYNHDFSNKNGERYEQYRWHAKILSKIEEKK